MTFELISPPTPKKTRIRRGGWSWGPVEDAKIRVLSLGGGIQSSTLALMAAHGEIDGPLPDFALTAEMEELDATEENIRWLGSGNMLPFPVEFTSKGHRLSDDIRARASGIGRGVSIPFFTEKGQANRQCTREFKIEPIEKEIRRRLGYKPRQRIPAKSAEIWIGYTTDEVIRAGASFSPWTIHRFPLLEKGMSIHDCVAWLKNHGYPVPVRSKCVFCPFRTDAEWRWMKENEPHNWQAAIEIDRLVRDVLRVKGYLHRSRVPLDRADLSTVEERGQGMLMVCEAGCGL